MRLPPVFWTTFIAALFCGLQGPALGQIQAGRDANGTLILTDQGLPSGAMPEPLALDQLMSLPEEAKILPKGNVSPAPSAAPPKQSAEQRATCQGINQRYAETQAELAQVEQKKAAGTLLIPESGMVTLRQNLATMARMRQLCP